MERSPGKQLFIDDYFIESLDGARRVLNQPQKLTVDEPLSIPFDRPWESQLAQPGRVIYDEHEQRFPHVLPRLDRGAGAPVRARFERRAELGTARTGTGGI